MNNPTLPQDFTERVINTHGDKGISWLNNLSGIIEYVKKAYQLSNIQAVPKLSYNYTTIATQTNGQQLIVKFCLPGIETDNEIYALKVMAGNGMVQLLDHNREQGILLLELCAPGDTLAVINDDDKATSIAANVMQKLWKPISDPHHFPNTEQWFTKLDRPVDLPNGFSISLLDRAKQVANELHQNSAEPVLLHGDLHHFNILSAHRQPWLAIDPKGIVGEREYEVGAFLRNPIPDIATTMNTKSILGRRVDLFAEILKFDRKKIAAWGFAQAILASIWCIDERSDDWKIFYHCAKALAKV